VESADEERRYLGGADEPERGSKETE